MSALFKKQITHILISLLLALIVLARLFPSAGATLGVLFMLAGFLVASFAIIQKHKETYLRGGITRRVFLRNVLLEVTGAGLAMILAGLLGRTIAGIATAAINDDLLKFAAGILIGLLTGIVVGIFVSQTWGRFVKTAPETK